MNSAIADEARRQWRKRPIAEYNCLETHNMSANQLAANGIGPNDPRVQRLFAQCAADADKAARVSDSPLVGVLTELNPVFVVDGLAVGAAVNSDSAVYKAYSCRPSDQFPGFKWCTINRHKTGKFGPYISGVTILHSDANTAVFILQNITPAYFASGDPEREILHLSRHFGQTARVLTGEPRPDAPHSVIAAWGDVTLTPLDKSTMEKLRSGEAITAGLLIDFLADSQKPARDGMPVFHLGRAAGYIWAAIFDDSGKGRLRVTAVNPSLLPGPVPAPPRPRPPLPSRLPQPQTPDRKGREERVISAGKAQLDDAAAFIEQHPQSPKLLDYVNRIGALKTAVKNGDLHEIERKSTELANDFSHDKDYQQYLFDLDKKRKEQNARNLVDAIHRAEQERDFILDYIGKNPLADATPSLATLVKQLPALQRADLDQLQPIVEKIDLAIREAHLEDAFNARKPRGRR